MAIIPITAYRPTENFSAADVAKINKAVYSGGNVVEADGGSLTETTNAAAHQMTLGAGVILFDGRHIVSTGATITYSLVSASTLYRKVITGMKYTKNAGTGVENIVYAYYESEEYASAAQADAAVITLPDDEITAATTEAFMPLYVSVVSNSAVVGKTAMFQTVKNYAETERKINEVESDITEIEAETTQNSTMIDRVKFKTSTTAASVPSTGMFLCMVTVSYSFPAITTSGGSRYETYRTTVPFFVSNGYSARIAYQLPIAYSMNVGTGLPVLFLSALNGNITAESHYTGELSHDFNGYYIDKTSIGHYVDYTPGISIDRITWTEVLS